MRFRCEIRLIFIHHIALPTHFLYGKPSLLNIRVSVEHIFKRSQRAILRDSLHEDLITVVLENSIVKLL